MIDEPSGTAMNLNESVLARGEWSALHRDVILGLLNTLNAEAPEHARATITLDRESHHRIAISPARPGPSSIEVDFYHNTAGGTIRICAGEGVGFCVPEDITRPIESALSDIVSSAVRAILKGQLRETVYEAGLIPYRWIFELPSDVGIIRIDRTNVPSHLRHMFKKKSTRTILYPPYVDSG